MCGTFEEPPTGLIPWFSKTEGNTYATIAASPSPLRGKSTQAQDVAQIYNDIQTGRITRSKTCLANFCEHYSFISSIEPIKVEEALEGPDSVNAMHK